MASKRGGLYGFLVLTAIAALAVFRLDGPEPRNDPKRFSATRAQQLMKQLKGDQVPHPVGSASNRMLRDRIVEALRAEGYQAEVQKEPVCNARGECATVENIVARASGRASTGTVMVACHYDSVPAGPGAGDDLSGVVVALQLAKLLQTIDRRNDVLFLIDDGEEAGLLGAEAFVRKHRWAKEVRVVINVEARGTSGPSHMFETSTDHGWLISLMQRSLSRPSSTSIFYSIYQRLPNDTDLTVFKRSGMEGVNFAFIGDPLRYHTPQDDIDNLSLNTLQHHGDNAWEMLQAFVRHDLARRGGGERSYFDVLGFFLLAWPTHWNIALAILAAVLLALAAARKRSSSGATEIARRSFASAFSIANLSSLLGLVLAALAGLGIARMIAAPTPFIASPQMATLGTSLLALALVLTVRGVTRTSTVSQLVAFGGGQLLFAVLAAIFLPGAAYVGLVMAFSSAAAVALFAPESRARTFGAVALAVAPPAIVALPLILLLPDGMGTMTFPGVALVAAMISLPVAAFAETRRSALGLAIAAAAGAIVILAIAFTTPPYSPSEPRPANVMLFHDADSGSTSWLIPATKPLPARLHRLATWSPSPASPFRGLRTAPAFHQTAAARSALPPPELQMISNEVVGNERRVTARIVSPRNAYRATLFLDRARSRFVSASINGSAVPRFDDRYWRGLTDGTLRFNLRGLEQGAIVQLRLSGTAPVTGYLYDTSFGVADDTIIRHRLRDESTLQDGDVTIVKREIRF